MNDITPKDPAEQTALGTGKRIAAVIAALATAVPTVCAAIGGLAWVSDHIPLLATGLGSLVAGGIASYIAVHRMKTDRKGGE